MQLSSFNSIRALAEARKGGKAALDKMAAHRTLTAAQLARIPDHRYLSMMTRCVFQAGFNWKVIEAKWDGFEAAFHGFNPKGLAHLAPDKWDAYLEDSRIVRNGVKIKALRDNARFLWQLQQEDRPFARVFAEWPADDQIGLMAWLKKEGARLGGNTAMYFMRFMGKDSFVLSADVTARLRASGLPVKETVTSMRDLRLVQEAFNQWHAETGLSYTRLSRIAAMSIGNNYPDLPVAATG